MLYHVRCCPSLSSAILSLCVPSFSFVASPVIQSNGPSSCRRLVRWCSNKKHSYCWRTSSVGTQVTGVCWVRVGTEARALVNRVERCFVGAQRDSRDRGAKDNVRHSSISCSPLTIRDRVEKDSIWSVVRWIAKEQLCWNENSFDLIHIVVYPIRRLLHPSLCFEKPSIFRHPIEQKFCRRILGEPCTFFTNGECSTIELTVANE